LSPLLAHHWINAQKLPQATIQRAIMLMGLTLAPQFAFSFYAGGLLGLQKQVLCNGIIIVMATIQNFGVILILSLISPTIQAFFIWQFIVSIVQAFVMSQFLWKSLPSTDQPATFRIELFLSIWRFATGLGWITISYLIISQLDKIVLSRLLTLEMFGYYTLASTIAMSLSYLIGPIYNATFPKITHLVSTGDENGLIKFYHQVSQAMSVLIVPPAIIIALFSSEILLLWTRNPMVADYAHAILSLLVIGTALNGLMHIPISLQLASGWTNLLVYTNIISIVFLVPSFIFLVLHYGAIGAAFVWVAFNCGYVFISLQFMYKRLLPEEKWEWYIKDLGIPTGLSIIVALFWFFILPRGISSYWLLLYLFLIWLNCVIAAILAAPQLYSVLHDFFLVSKTYKNWRIY
jgi:O-antigen/teichoic acid export membrane protein